MFCGEFLYWCYVLDVGVVDEDVDVVEGLFGEGY